jgi:DNA repair exonuclease SbcCD ATPase subunit
MTMRIKTITLENFRCYEHQTFEFGPVTTIYGHNGAGKSTLAEAVVWCLYGTNILGKSKQDESLMRLGAKDMAVAVTFVDAAGKEIVLARTRAGKKASVLTVNGRRPKPGEIEGMFGTVSEFLSVFLPGYFSSLEPKEAKAILAKCVPDVPKEDVLARMSPDAAELLAHDQFAMGIDSIEVATRKVRNEIHELEQELLRSEGEMRAYTSVLEQGPPKPFESRVSAEDRQRYEMAKRTILKYEAQLEQRESRLKELKAERARLGQKYREIKSNPPKVETHCYACGQALPADKVQAVREKAIREYKERLEEVVEQGKQVRAELDRLEVLPTTPKLDAAMEALMKRVEKALEEERQLQVQYEAALKSYQVAKEKTAELRTFIEQDRQNLEALQRKLKVLQEFRFEYIRAQHEKLNGLFENVRIHLMDVNKETGEIRESFRIEWKGRPYRLLSFSEKVRCDIEIGRVLAFARGEEMPVYVDNAESVQNLFSETFSGQVIAAFVADSELTIKREGDSAVA